MYNCIIIKNIKQKANSILTMFVASCVTTLASKSETSNKNNTILDYENDAITAKDDTAMMMWLYSYTDMTVWWMEPTKMSLSLLSKSIFSVCL